MFKEAISSPIAPLTQNYFKTLARPDRELDWSLSSLGVALLKPRIPQYQGIFGYISSGATKESAISHIDLVLQDKRNRKEACKSEPFVGYYMMSLTSDSVRYIKEHMERIGCEEVQPIEAYVKQELSMDLFAAFMNKETNSAFIFTGTSNLALYHLCWAFISTLLPMAFESCPITPEEVQIVKALSHRTPAQFMELMSKMLNPLKPELMRAELNQCFRGFREAKVQAAERTVNDIQARIDELMERYRRQMDELNNAIVMFEGLKVVNADGNNEQEQEAIDYLVENPRLHNVSYSNGSLTFDVDTYLTNIDVMKFRNAVRTKDIYDAYRVDPNSPFASRTNRKLLMDALFNEYNPKLCVRIRGHIVLQINRNWMDAPRHNDFDESNPALANCLTNPHFKLHSCPGQNREQIMQCLREADIVSAIECSVAATGSVNIAETDITFRPFVQEILSSDKKIIHREDGVDMTPAEALLWLTKKQGEAA